MLNLFLVLFCIVVWIALYALYFRPQIRAWFENNFGKDKPPVTDALPEPISYKQPDKEADG